MTITARLEESLLERLEAQSRRSGQTRSQLTARLLDEEAAERVRRTIEGVAA